MDKFGGSCIQNIGSSLGFLTFDSVHTIELRLKSIPFREVLGKKISAFYIIKYCYFLRFVINFM